MKYAIVVVSPIGYIHSQAFAEVAESLRWGLDELGHDVVISEVPMRDRRSIILGANLLGSVHWTPSPESIIYNLEQIEPSSMWLTPRFRDTLRSGFEVWDYDQANADRYHLIDCPPPTKIVPIGYAPTLYRIPDLMIKDIDVLFYGSMNDRRFSILSDLRSRGLNALAVFGVYGAERDALIGRSKLVLNVHFYESKVFEIVRVSYLLANDICVVSETPIDPSLAGSVAFASYEGLVNCCAELLADDHLRNEIAQAGGRIMRSRQIDRILTEALAEKPPSSPRSPPQTLGSERETGGSTGVSEGPTAPELARALRALLNGGDYPGRVGGPIERGNALIDRCPKAWFKKRGSK